MPRTALLAFALAAAAVSVTLASSPSLALEVNGRRLEVAGNVDTKVGAKLVTDMMKLDEASSSPIYLFVSGAGGSAQGVMLVADAIRSIESPVVAVVLAPVHGATATLPLFADRLVMLPNAQLVFTEVDYEGVPRPPEPRTDEAAANPGAPPATPRREPTKAETFLQTVRKDYLDRFWNAVNKRMNDKPGAMQAAIEANGGRLMTSQEALQKKVAFEVVASLTTTRSANEKTEIKATTTRNRTRTAAPVRPNVN